MHQLLCDQNGRLSGKYFRLGGEGAECCVLMHTTQFKHACHLENFFRIRFSETASEAIFGSKQPLEQFFHSCNSMMSNCDFLHTACWKFNIPDFPKFLVLLSDDLLCPLALYRVHFSLAQFPPAPLETKSHACRGHKSECHSYNIELHCGNHIPKGTHIAYWKPQPWLLINSGFFLLLQIQNCGGQVTHSVC